MAWSCRSHSPPWSQIGQSSGWLMSRNSITPSRAFFTIGVFVNISGGSPLGPGRKSLTAMAQEAWGLGRRALHFDEAQAAIAGDRRALVIAEAGNLGARRFCRLHQREVVRN